MSDLMIFVYFLAFAATVGATFAFMFKMMTSTLALFVDGLLRMLGIIPPFMHLDINILDKIELDIIDKIKQVPIQKLFHKGRLF